MGLEVSRLWLIGLLLVVASWTDIRSGRIPNALTLPVAIAAFVVCLLPGQAEGALWYALKGFFIGGALLMPFYLLRLLGAGDVKLMAVLGALLGWPLIGGITALSLVLAGVLSLVLAFRGGVVRQVLSNVYQALWGLVHWRALGRSAGNALQLSLTGRRSPHAVAVALAWLLYVMAQQGYLGVW